MFCVRGMESEHDSFILCVYPNMSVVLVDLEGDVVLALELIHLDGSREQEVAAGCCGRLVFSSHELVGIQVEGQLVGSSRSLLLLCLRLIEILASESCIIKAD